MKKKRETSYFDYTLLIIIFFLIAFGLVMLYSTSSYSASVKFNDPMFFLKKQLFNYIFSFAAFIAAIVIDYHRWYKPGKGWYVLSLMAVLSVLTPLGYSENGARRWINLKVITLQPAEIAKITMILYFAYFFCHIGKNVTKRVAYVRVIFAVALVSGIVWIANDNLSTAIIIAGIVMVMFFVASPEKKPFIIMAITVAVVVAAVIIRFRFFPLSEGSSFRAERIVVWMDPESYSKEGGFQVLQGLYAIGSGGIFGKGLGNSIQKLGFIPEAQNDMIFSIICEELGMFGAVCVMLVFVVMIWRFMVIATNAPDLFGAMIVVGAMAHISIQVILNIAVVTNSIPNTGVTLPFISYGGTSAMFLMFEMGVVLNVSKQIRIKK